MKNKVNEITITYNEKIAFSTAINNSKDAGQLLYKHWNTNTIGVHETFKILLLNNANKVKGIYEVSSGGITSTLVDIRMLFAVVLKSLSVGIILAHNHPSGKLIPSAADKRITEKIKNAARLLDVKVLDHIILAPNGSYYSFEDHAII